MEEASPPKAAHAGCAQKSSPKNAQVGNIL
jgi:hypothetical protein